MRYIIVPDGTSIEDRTNTVVNGSPKFATDTAMAEAKEFNTGHTVFDENGAEVVFVGAPA